MDLRPIEWRRTGAWVLALIVPLLAISVIIILLTGGSSNTRSFLIEARTTGVTIKFSGLGNVWPLGKVTVCQPLSRPDRTADRGSGQCDHRLYEETHFPDLLLDLSDGGQAIVTVSRGTGLAIAISDIKGFNDRTRILLDVESWQAAGALAFSGGVAIGGEMGSGQKNFVLGGRFEVRESPKIPFGRSGRIDVIKSGQLLRGEQVRIVTPEGPSDVVGHITPALGDVGGLNVVVVSLPGNTSLSLGYLGGDSASTITPDWIDHAIANPVLIALTFILTMCIGAGQLIFDALGYLRNRPEKREEYPVSDHRIDEGRGGRGTDGAQTANPEASISSVPSDPPP